MLQYLLCRWANEAFALDTREVIELIRMVQITRLPTEAGRIDGLINYRGQMVPVLDSCRLFQKPSQAYDTDSLIVVMRHEGQLVAVVAHELLELHEVEADQLQVHDATQQEPFDAALRLDEGHLYPVLNLKRLQQDAKAALQILAQSS